MPMTPSVRVVVKLPYDRPENPLNDPPKIEWTAEKADILWKVIERSRSVDSPGADWKGLAAHLEVPLPYLLYRINARFQEDIRGLRDIQGALSPTSAQSQKAQDFPEKPQTLASRMAGSDPMSSSRLGSPLGVRARLNSLGTHSPKPKHTVSSSTLTLQAANARKSFAPMEPPSPSTDSESDSDDSEVDRKAEADDSLTRKLADLQKMMTVDTIGLVTRNRARAKGKARDRGRSAPLSPRSVGSLSSRVDTLSSRSASQSVSSASSPQGSIPEITSTSGDSQPQSPMGRNLSHKSSSPPALSSRNALSHAHNRRYDRTSDFGGSLGSGVSSLSDLSDASFSASALDSSVFNLGSNSRLSQLNRTRASNRTHSVVPQ